MLTATELAEMSADVEAGLNDAVSILRRAPAKSSTGANLQTYAVQHSGVPCKPAPMSSNRKQALGERSSAVNPMTFRLKHDADVLTTDRLQWGARVFEIVGVRRRGATAVETAVDAVQLDS